MRDYLCEGVNFHADLKCLVQARLFVVYVENLPKQSFANTANLPPLSDFRTLQVDETPGNTESCHEPGTSASSPSPRSSIIESRVFPLSLLIAVCKRSSKIVYLAQRWVWFVAMRPPPTACLGLSLPQTQPWSCMVM